MTGPSNFGTSFVTLQPRCCRAHRRPGKAWTGNSSPTSIYFSTVMVAFNFEDQKRVLHIDVIEVLQNTSWGISGKYPLVNSHIAIENGHRVSGFTQLK